MEENRTEPEIRREGATKVQHSAPNQGAAIPSASPSPARLPGDATGPHETACASCQNEQEVVCPDCDGHGWYARQVSEDDCEQAQCAFCNATGWRPCPDCNPEVLAGSDAGERGA